MATNNNINTGKPIEVVHGGTQLSSVNAYSVLCGGTTSTGPLQYLPSNGTSGQVLTSQGSSALPAWSTTPNGSLVLIQTQTASSSSSINFTSGISNTYNTYMVTINNLTQSNASTLYALRLQFSSNGGSSYYSSGYTSWITYTPLSSISWGGATATSFIEVGNNITTNTIPNNIVFYIFEMTSGNGPMVTIPGLDYFGIAGRYLTMGIGYYSPGTAMNALSFSMSNGSTNISTGTFSLYGLTY